MTDNDALRYQEIILKLQEKLFLMHEALEESTEFVRAAHIPLSNMIGSETIYKPLLDKCEKALKSTDDELSDRDYDFRDVNLAVENGILEFACDMTPEGAFLRIIQQDDGDIILAIANKDVGTTDVEFCTPIMGGGRNRALWMALAKFFNEARKVAEKEYNENS